MTSGGRWLRGWGVGCGVVLLAAIGACVVGTVFVRHTFRGIDKANASQEALERRLGGVEDYTPPAHGTPPTERLETFTRVRELTAEARGEVDARLAPLPGQTSGRTSMVGQVRVGLRTLGNLIDAVGSYLQARNRALIEHHMGIGEYVYIYTLVYHSWLGHSPAEAPEAREGGDDIHLSAFDDSDALFGASAVRRRYRRYVLAMTRAQAASLERAPEAGRAEAWRARLERRVRRLEVDPGHVLWHDGLPEEVETALDPFRDRLEATWSPSTNRLELPLAEHETPWDWR